MATSGVLVHNVWVSTSEIVLQVSAGWNTVTCTWNKQFLRGAL